MRWAGAGVLLVPLLLSGCFQAILREGPRSTLDFTCALMDSVQDDRIVVESWRAAEVDLNVTPILRHLVAILANLTGRDPGLFSVDERAGPDVPPGGWNRSRLAQAAGPYLRQRTVTLAVFWVASVGEWGPTGFLVAPGTVAVAMDNVAAGSARIGRPVAAVAQAVLLHEVGHALGQTNQGIPVQDPDIQDREGPPGHDRDPASVLHDAWDDAFKLAWAGNATYDGYPAPDLADWAAARSPGGVCG
jgi:hypothetical protein